jgi:hypothetical protein
MEVVLCIAAVCAIVFRKQWSDYWALGTWLTVRGTSGLVSAVLF